MAIGGIHFSASLIFFGFCCCLGIWSHNSWYSGLTELSALESLLEGSGKHIEYWGIIPRFAVCKTNYLPAVLWLYLILLLSLNLTIGLYLS